MSHFTTIETQIRDIQALQDACKEIGLELAVNTVARGYGRSTRQGDYVIRLKGPYDIALNKQPDGTYGLTTDWWQGHVEKEVGRNYGRLLQLSGVHKTIRESLQRGYRVKRSAAQDGSIRVTVGLPAGR